MAFGTFVRTLGWWLVPLVVVAVPMLLIWTYRTRAGKRVMDELALWVPVLGSLLKKLDTTRFARALATLMGAGVDVGTSLDLAGDVMQLDPLRRAVRRAKVAVMEGNELSASLAASHRFAPDVIAIISSGEDTGKLPESLEHLADEYEEQVAYMVKNMGQLDPAAPDDRARGHRPVHHPGRTPAVHRDPDQPVALTAIAQPNPTGRITE